MLRKHPPGSGNYIEHEAVPVQETVSLKHVGESQEKTAITSETVTETTVDNADEQIALLGQEAKIAAAENSVKPASEEKKDFIKEIAVIDAPAAKKSFSKEMSKGIRKVAALAAFTVSSLFAKEATAQQKMNADKEGFKTEISQPTSMEKHHLTLDEVKTWNRFIDSLKYDLKDVQGMKDMSALDDWDTSVKEIKKFNQTSAIKITPTLVKKIQGFIKDIKNAYRDRELELNAEGRSLFDITPEQARHNYEANTPKLFLTDYDGTDIDGKVGSITGNFKVPEDSPTVEKQTIINTGIGSGAGAAHFALRGDSTTFKEQNGYMTPEKIKKQSPRPLH